MCASQRASRFSAPVGRLSPLIPRPYRCTAVDENLRVSTQTNCQRSIHTEARRHGEDIWQSELRPFPHAATVGARRPGRLPSIESLASFALV